ncbi:uncharacterized protein LOC131653000 [Vicia villosa]|uniref:uncharacterized protein LOC131653000 n=1 Tax=Vicia villosa TaxID=3911 RepID=UPI00273C08D0|nr:uncharacterized protein LOC131653000 [Vicia villosa]
MHLWPTKNLRDSFKLSYLKNLEWNYQRMEKDKQRQSSTKQKLLEDDDNNNVVDTPQTRVEVVASIGHELLLIFSCCYCCFCCGACVEEK